MEESTQPRGHVAWPRGYVATWLHGYIATWLRGHIELRGHAWPRSHVATWPRVRDSPRPHGLQADSDFQIDGAGLFRILLVIAGKPLCCWCLSVEESLLTSCDWVCERPGHAQDNTSSIKGAGLGWLFEITQLPVIGQLIDFAYAIFATIRTDVTRGRRLGDLVAEYKSARDAASCKVCDREPPR